MNKFKIAIAFSLIALSGCNPSENVTGVAQDVAETLLSATKIKAPLFAIQTPYIFIIDGQKVQVRGTDICYDESECILLDKSFADVYLLLPEGAHKERWSIIKEENSNLISLRQPDGTVVMPVN